MSTAPLTLHRPLQLGPDVVRLGQTPGIQEVLPTPVLVAAVRFVCVVNVQKGQVVAIWMRELGLCLVGLFTGVGGAHEYIGD
jgi:hypothetical protein